ncbi:hypothetical protein MSAN_01744500 [Mycena sanguinolenta]|uniref:Uncharacterized protein n=1 Tax=Mycena sanguinolenta TaxID=230812 RepID=A0A8H7CVI3_9AGAR|nr:hypothetical protein MSAN_01744500 [Mycena sanguinolenta]
MPPINVWTDMPPDEEPDPQFFKKQFVVDNRMCFVEVLTPTVGQVSKPPEDDILAKSQGFVLVYSITSRSSFDHVEEFHQAAVRVKGSNAVFILVGNKCDRQWMREKRPRNRSICDSTSHSRCAYTCPILRTPLRPPGLSIAGFPSLVTSYSDSHLAYLSSSPLASKTSYRQGGNLHKDAFPGPSKRDLLHTSAYDVASPSAAPRPPSSIDGLHSGYEHHFVCVWT